MAHNSRQGNRGSCSLMDLNLDPFQEALPNQFNSQLGFRHGRGRRNFRGHGQNESSQQCRQRDNNQAFDRSYCNEYHNSGGQYDDNLFPNCHPNHPPVQNHGQRNPHQQNHGQRNPHQQNQGQNNPHRQNQGQRNPHRQNQGQRNPLQEYHGQRDPQQQNQGQRNPHRQNQGQRNPHRQNQGQRNPLQEYHGQRDPHQQNQGQRNPNRQNQGQRNPLQEYHGQRNPQQQNQGQRNPYQEYHDQRNPHQQNQKQRSPYNQQNHDQESSYYYSKKYQDYSDFPPQHENMFDQCPSPPPSYEESMRQHTSQSGMTPSAPPLACFTEDLEYSPHFNSSQQQTTQDRKIYCPENQRKSEKRNLPPTLGPEELVEVLAHLNEPWGKVDIISRRIKRRREEVIQVAKCHKNIFSYIESDEGIIELVPKVNLCSKYLSREGCISFDTCKDLHLCKFFIIGFCKRGTSCNYGHKWDTDHNSCILSKLYLDRIHSRVLHCVIKKVCKGTIFPSICNFYNRNQGCKKNERCGNLHICKNYVESAGNCHFKENCKFNHDVLTDHCKILLKRYDISRNETPRDILSLLISSLQHQEENKSLETKSCEAEYSNGDESDSNYSTQSGASYRSKKGGTRGKHTQRKDSRMLYRATHVFCDVEVLEICMCDDDDECIKKACRYMHAKSPFHWQFEKDNKWYNFRIYQSKILETAYRDVSKCSIQIPYLDPQKLEGNAKELLKFLGTESWMANFQDMTLNNSSRTKRLNIRRLSTRSAALSESPKSTVYDWYFVDEQGKWIRYGQVDSLGKQELVCRVSSEDIEKQYLSDPTSSMIIRNSKYQYNLDFSKMTQTNLMTNKERKVLRRPSQLTYLKKSTNSDDSKLPSHWEPMTKPHDLYVVVHSSSEYQKVASRLQLTLPTAKIYNICRLQNPYLWHSMQYKKKDLSQRYDELQLNVQQLFHGTAFSNLDTIYKENIDRRRQDTSARCDYGKGNYFSNSAAVALKNCTPDVCGL